MKKTNTQILILSLIILATKVSAFKPLPYIKSTNIYEVNVRQYTPEGTFNAFAKHLPRLQKMGVKTIWFMPIHPIGKLNRKGGLGSYYSIQDYKGINPEFGTLQDFKNTVNLAHKLGMKVIIDVVANHTAWDNEWVTTHPEYYAKDSTGKMFSPFDWADVVQVDTKSIAFRNAIINSLQYWVKTTGIDGYRCDVADFLPLEFWKETRTQVDKIKPLMWLAESSNPKYFEAFDILYGWEWLHKMEDFYKGKTNLAGLDSLIENYYADYKKNKFRILFTTNHDENSWSGSEDERFGESKLAFATMCATLPGIPLVYSGQEEALTKRLRFFEKDTIGFKNYSLQNFYTNLLTTRKPFATKLPNYSKIIKPGTIITYPYYSTRSKNAQSMLINLTPKTKIAHREKNDYTFIVEDANVEQKGIKESEYLHIFQPWEIKIFNTIY